MNQSPLSFDTAIAAHARIAGGKQQTRTQKLLGFARARRPYGITVDEAAVDFNCGYNHVAPRMSELFKQRLLREAARRRQTRTGSPASVLVHFEFAESCDVTISCTERARMRGQH